MTKGKKKKQKINKTPKKRPALKKSKKSSIKKHIDVNVNELQGIVDKVQDSLGSDELEKLKGAIDTLAFLTSEIEKKGTSISRLRRLLFGPTSEKAKDILPKEDGSNDASKDNCPKEEKSSPEESNKTKKKRKGHGRKAASEYKGAEKVTVSHQALKSGQICPDCLKGKLYLQKEPSCLVRVSGMAPLQATVYELEKLRCNLCGRIFTAKEPEGVGRAKYDETAVAMIAMLKYGCGLPFNRLERLEGSLGIPLPAGTQWDLLDDGAEKLEPVYIELIREAAQGKVLYNDDTVMKILDLEKRLEKEGAKRKGIYTSGILSTNDEQQIALFFTGVRHAGENLDRLLAQRSQELSAPIQMCDGLSRNIPANFKTILCNCMIHARRNFVDITTSFPGECKRLIEDIRTIYENDQISKDENMSDEERLLYHQEHSNPILDDLFEWLEEQFKEKKVERNSVLGEALKYMIKRKDTLTSFLREPGAPLDNNACERIIKKAILHRKNAYFYKTQRGADVGDMFMALIHTSELNDVNPFDYLVALLKNFRKVAKASNLWMPWNYKENLQD